METKNSGGVPVSDAGRQHQEHFQRKVEDVKNNAILKGKHDALDGKPEIHGTSLFVHLEHVQAIFNSFLAEHREHIELHVNSARSILYATKCELTPLWKRKYELELQPLLPTVNQHDPIPSAKRGYVKLLLCLLAILFAMGGESVLLGESLQVLTHNRLFAILLGIGFSVVFLIIFHYGYKLVQKAASRAWKNGIAIGLSLLVVLSFIGLAIFRAEYLHTKNGSDISLLWFIIFNLLFSLGLFLLIRFGIQSALENIRKAGILKPFQIRRKNPAKELAKIDKRISEFNGVRDAAEAYETEFLTLSKTTELKLVHAYFECVALYKSNNMSTRNAVPDSFRHAKPPPLYFYYITIEDIKNDNQSINK